MSAATRTLRRESPSSQEEAAELLSACAAEGGRVRAVGGGTKLGWGRPAADPDLELSTRALDRVLEHNAGDMTAVLEPGVRLAAARERFAESGQMLALDPPLGGDDAATIGGVLATADSGPLRHRYAAARDLIVGVRVALSDGTVAKAGGKVIKNVAGYDLAKLFTGSFGTLGFILQATVRLQPRPETTATATAASDDPEALHRAVAALGHSHLEMLCFDVRWEGGSGSVLARFGGAVAEDQGRAAVRLVDGMGLDAGLVADDARLWDEQRTRQRARAPEGTVVRVAGRQSQLVDVLRAADGAAASVTGRAALGVYWVGLGELPEDDAIVAVGDIRRALAPSACVVLDAPAAVRTRIDPWDERDGARLALMRRVKERFDPLGACNPGVFVGGI